MNREQLAKAFQDAVIASKGHGPEVAARLFARWLNVRPLVRGHVAQNVVRIMQTHWDAGITSADVVSAAVADWVLDWAGQS